MVLRDPAPTEAEAVGWWRQQGAAVLTTEQHPPLAGLFEHTPDADAFVVRPDRYTFGAGPLAQLTAAARRVLAPG